MSKKLYEIAEDFKAVADALENADTNLKEILESSLSQVEMELGSKLENIVKLRKHFEAEADKFKAVKDEFQAKERVMRNKANSLKEYMEDTLLSLGYDADSKKKVDAGLWTIAMQKSAPSLKVEDESLIPDEYFVEKKELQRRQVLDALKEGAEIEGATITQSQHVRVR